MSIYIYKIPKNGNQSNTGEKEKCQKRFFQINKTNKQKMRGRGGKMERKTEEDENKC